MDPLLIEMVGTLAQARQAVEHEMKAICLDQASAGARLAHLQRSVADFSAQADSLVVTMLDREADDDYIEVAEQLVDFFQDTEAQIRTMLAAGRG